MAFRDNNSKVHSYPSEKLGRFYFGFAICSAIFSLFSATEAAIFSLHALFDISFGHLSPPAIFHLLRMRNTPSKGHPNPQRSNRKREFASCYGETGNSSESFSRRFHHNQPHSCTLFFRLYFSISSIVPNRSLHSSFRTNSSLSSFNSDPKILVKGRFLNECDCV